VLVLHCSDDLSKLLNFKVSHKRFSLGIGYDGVKTLLMSRGLADDGIQLHILASISASFGASILSAPADFIMSKYMNSNKSLFHCIQNVYRENGLAGFWRGWPIFFFRLTPVMLTYSTIYEQLRCQLGLGYFS
jgi:Mitochondrial carrier protein